MPPVEIHYFSDVLCIWAFVGQARVDELRATFGDQILLRGHFLDVFGDASERLASKWKDRGGLAAYGAHVREVAGRFDHVTVHDDAWARCAPTSSLSAHLFLRAVSLVADDTEVVEGAVRAVREAFFVRGRDVSTQSVLRELAEERGLPLAEIERHLESGRAHAALARDLRLSRDLDVRVSPSLVFNEGRQRLNGNVGYRVIEANVRELLNQPADEASWC